jgi:hypothetical protein
LDERLKIQVRGAAKRLRLVSLDGARGVVYAPLSGKNFTVQLFRLRAYDSFTTQNGDRILPFVNFVKVRIEFPLV